MAIPAGHRFPITFDELFPMGFYVLSVDRASEYSEGKAPRPAVDKVSGRPVWTVQGTDPSGKGQKSAVTVKIAADVQPVPPEVAPGTPFRPVVFLGLKVTPYVRDGWIAYTVWAEEMLSPDQAKRSTRAPSRSDGGAASSSSAAA